MRSRKRRTRGKVKGASRMRLSAARHHHSIILRICKNQEPTELHSTLMFLCYSIRY